MTLEQTIQHYRAELLRIEQQAEHKIRSAHAHMLSVVWPHLQALLKLIREALEAGQKLLLSWLYEHDRLASLKHLVATQVNQFGVNAKAQVLTAQHKGVLLGEASAYSQFREAAPNKGVKSPTNTALFKPIGQTQQGKPISDLIDSFGQEASDRVGKALIAGVSTGQQPDTISRALMAALVICLNRALVIDRTSMMESYRASVLLTFQINNDIARMWEWHAQPGACPFCQKMDGTRHDISEDMISHPNCRCQMKLITV